MDVSRLVTEIYVHGPKFYLSEHCSWAVSKYPLSKLWSLLVMVYTVTVAVPFAATLSTLTAVKMELPGQWESMQMCCAK